MRFLFRPPAADATGLLALPWDRPLEDWDPALLMEVPQRGISRHVVRFIREAADRYGYVLDGWVNDVGYQSVAVPGTVAGLHEALHRFGTISWAEAIEPAIPLARHGFPVSGFMHGYWVTDYGPDVVPNAQRIQATPAARAIYTHEGRLYEIGEVMVQADMARTLERLADGGPDVFYRGEIADSIAADFATNGGFITKEDLETYQVNVTEPMRGTYRGHQVAAAGPPAGGLTLLQMLNFLEGYDIGSHGWPSTEAARLLVEAMAWAVADRELHVADPRFVEVPMGALADKDYAARARAVVHDRAETTHVCVVDDAGNAVSLTHTLGSASGVVTPGLGFGYNDYMNCFDPRPGRPNSVRPGKTPRFVKRRSLATQSTAVKPSAHAPLSRARPSIRAGRRRKGKTTVQPRWWLPGRATVCRQTPFPCRPP